MVESSRDALQPVPQTVSTASGPDIEVIKLRMVGCRYCHGSHVVKYGTYKGNQRYYCRSCQRKFADSPALPYKRFTAEQVGSAVGMFYRGLSTKEIGQQLGEQHGIPPPSKSTVYRWVTEYTKSALKQVDSQKAKTGETWVADETVIWVDGKKHWLWDVMDSRTRFLLASRLSATRGTRDAELVFRQAALRVSRPPKWIVTDRLASYIDGIERVFGSESRHVPANGIRAKLNNNLSERLQGTIKQRTKVMRGLQSRKTAQLVLDGWALHYNYFRPHEALDNKTPAEMAGVQAPFKDWQAIARRDFVQREFPRERVLGERRVVRERTFRIRRGSL